MLKEKEQKRNTYIPGLDGLRAIAVLAVIAYHLNFKWASGGLLGVCLFFVLSGYLITDLLVSQWNLSARIDFKDFFQRRARRLLPALLVMLAGTVIWTVLLNPARLDSLKGDILAAVFYLNNWWLIFHDVSYFASFGPPSPLGHLWSLAVEGQFYLVWPVLLGLGLRYLPRRGWLVVLTLAGILASGIAMALLYQPGTDPSRVYYGTDTRVSALLIGAILALALPRQKLSLTLPSRDRLLLDLVGAAALIAVLLMIWQTNEYDSFLYRGGLLLFSLISAVLIAVLAHPAGRLAKLLGKQPLRWLGVRSYAIYLWHYPVILLTSPSVNTGGLDMMLVLKQLAAIIILAELSWQLIEKPVRFRAEQRQPGKFPDLKYRLRSLGRSMRFALAFYFLGLSVLTIAGVTCLKTKDLDTVLSIIGVSSAPEIKTAEQIDFASASSSMAVLNLPAAKPKPEPEAESESKPEAAQPPVSPPKTGSGQGVIIIGDSVIAGAKSALEERLPGIEIDAQIGRQMDEAVGLVNRLKTQSLLGERVIIELGTNGPFSQVQLRDLLDSLGQVKQIILVNTRVPRPWQDEVNETLERAAVSYPGTKLVDWYLASTGHHEYFYEDGVHLTPKGIEVYCQLLQNALTPL
ncbi:peptidoglycan-N-acetylmuramate O-acetyltransferase [Syntrophobotulus glycolicus DSM 8271]|uniref:Peptidoglycan-N-acetylmuramate O-acetyltransferase n=1 Tax=Syntrophobotulus glycolicus (strain DSM 8271 / FlGlyR) TaxID=645991 RepID=F0T034_SYNGF|nr:acyltransferase family protein [Syntrophobotulus glycolicus]ADY56121.1 peptidoglycan-N-acetylmuramate O-acetyltransferase [Syntrophobotulus glycolicus DSM 8271]